MNNHPDHSPGQYTCNEYRAEMILLALHKQLQLPNLTEVEKERIIGEIVRLEKIVGLS